MCLHPLLTPRMNTLHSLTDRLCQSVSIVGYGVVVEQLRRASLNLAFKVIQRALCVLHNRHTFKVSFTLYTLAVSVCVSCFSFSFSPSITTVFHSFFPSFIFIHVLQAKSICYRATTYFDLFYLTTELLCFFNHSRTERTL